ncbi:MAG: hypothetical protein DRI65_11765 [Chloroflexota bacterium]|nr:MAG: hypothetical protein DRI65_11765 [Chloroflexota bacterium]
MVESQPARLKQALAALREGDLSQARALILAELRANPNNLATWLWALEVANTDKEKRSILGKILSLDPSHKGALQYLKNLDQAAGVNSDSSSQGTGKAEAALSPKPEDEKGRVGGIVRLFTDWITNLPLSCGFIALFALIIAVAFIYFRVNTSLYGLFGNDFDDLIVSNSYETISAGDMYWEVQFESIGETKYIGIVRHVSPIRINEFRILTHDILVTTADFSNPDIVDTSVINHKFTWEPIQVSDPAGSINLIHAFPANKEIYQELLKIQNWDTVKITGREIYTVKAYQPDETFLGTWKDSGCNTLLIESVSIIHNSDE